MYDIPPLQYLCKIFTCASKVTLSNIRKGFVKVTFPSPFQYLNSSLSKSLSTLNVYFRTVLYRRSSVIMSWFFTDVLFRIIGAPSFQGVIPMPIFVVCLCLCRDSNSDRSKVNNKCRRAIFLIAFFTPPPHTPLLYFLFVF